MPQEKYGEYWQRYNAAFADRENPASGVNMNSFCEKANHDLSDSDDREELNKAFLAKLTERERLTVLSMLLENLGIDKAVQFGDLEDWKSAIEEREKRQGQ